MACWNSCHCVRIMRVVSHLICKVWFGYLDIYIFFILMQSRCWCLAHFVSCCGRVKQSTAALSVCAFMVLLLRSTFLCLCLNPLRTRTLLCLSVSVLVCVSLRQPGLSSLDNQSLALVRQPSEAERSKAGADVYRSVYVYGFVCARVRSKVTQPL